MSIWKRFVSFCEFKPVKNPQFPNGTLVRHKLTGKKFIVSLTRHGWVNPKERIVFCYDASKKRFDFEEAHLELDKTA